ncbi:uncharacterized protein METZ01_LOCUS249043 [marine metagenome]|uniref:Uncharacterized protein n=1 Tax=marine metagenome TaxID=408172 RepID=A0A382IAA6_9ZZZZ
MGGATASVLIRSMQAGAPSFGSPTTYPFFILVHRPAWVEGAASPLVIRPQQAGSVPFRCPSTDPFLRGALIRTLVGTE